MKAIRTFFLVSLISLMAGCSWIEGMMPEQEDETKTWSASKFYAEAKANMQGGDYETAVELYQKLIARFPHGRYAQQGLLEMAYAYYKDDEPELAISTANRFIKLHPQHPNVDYAFYIRGLAVFPARANVLEHFFPQDESARDPRSSLESFEYFSELVNRYPNSKYAEDASARMAYLRNKVARHEIHVARFYMSREAYVAAANRAEYVVNHFQRTPSVKDALEILVDSYEAMELPELAADTRRVLELNAEKMPESTYEPDTGLIEEWLDKAWGE